jgi:divalent metal cation (Fe/Co/Zn/Cd) transporter
LILVWVCFLWNFLEAGVAFWSAFIASSVALLAFGLDSLVEIFAGAVLIWRLSMGEQQQEEGAELLAFHI